MTGIGLAPNLGAYVGKNARALRQRDFAAKRALPVTMATPPTVTISAANAASSVTSGVAFRAGSPDYWRTYGGNPQLDVNGYANVNANQQTVTGVALANPAWAREFISDSPKFELTTQGKGANSRLLFLENGKWVYASPVLTGIPADGSIYRVLVDWTAQTTPRQMRHYRFEMDGFWTFGAITALATDTFKAPAYRGFRFIAVGDSFAEPTIMETGAVYTRHEGFVGVLGKLMDNPDMWSSSLGATGYLTTAGSRGTPRGRFTTDVSANHPDILGFFSGINDANRVASIGTTAAALQTECTLLFQKAVAENPNALIFATSGFMGHQGTNYQIPGVALSGLQVRDAIKAAAVTAGILFLDFLETGIAGSTTTSATSSGSQVYSTGAITPGSIIRVGTPNDSFVWNTVALASSGSGPYTLTVSPNLGSSAPAGSVLTVVGPSFTHGTGVSAAVVGDGPADFHIGTDSTHPTVAGQTNIAYWVWDQLLAALPA